MFGNSTTQAIARLPRIGIMVNGTFGSRHPRQESTHSKLAKNTAKRAVIVYSTIGEDEMSKNVFSHGLSDSASQDKPRRSLSPRSKTTRAMLFPHHRIVKIGGWTSSQDGSLIGLSNGSRTETAQRFNG
jgi:6-phosphogluconolactonase (cycloisomerase 2 family)